MWWPHTTIQPTLRALRIEQRWCITSLIDGMEWKSRGKSRLGVKSFNNKFTYFTNKNQSNKFSLNMISSFFVVSFSMQVQHYSSAFPLLPSFLFWFYSFLFLYPARILNLIRLPFIIKKKQPSMIKRPFPDFTNIQPYILPSIPILTHSSLIHRPKECRRKKLNKFY